jgi:hypothetical protein
LDCDSLLQVGAKEYDLNDAINFYPNPASGKVTLTLPFTVKLPCELLLTDLSGRVVERIIISNKTQLIDITDLQPGLYFATLDYDMESRIIGKIIKR